MSKRSCQIYLCTHEDGTKSGILLERVRDLFDPPAPSAFGASEEAVELQLESELAKRMADEPFVLGRFLWEERLETQRLRIDVPLPTLAGKRAVIGKRKVPLLVTYAYCALAGGGYRVLAPRLGVELVLEELALAGDVLRQALTQLLLGESPRELYELRAQPEEIVRPWTPSVLRKRGQEISAGTTQPPPTLAACADDLVERARRGRLAHVVGSHPLIDTLVESDVLVPPSIVLVGPSGVGKSSWVRALAQRLARGSERGLARRLWLSTPDRIVAGLPYLGQWQARCLALVEELSYEGDLLHLDHLPALVQPLHGEASIADFLDGPLEEGAITILAEATEPELELAQRTNPTFVSRFRIVRLEEPSTEAVIALLAAQAERGRGPTLHALAYKRLLRHLEVFARESALPGKALRFLEWLATSPQPDLPERLSARDLSRAYARYAGVPYALLADDEPKGRALFAAELSARVIGQDHACDVAARALARLKAAMTDPARPVASFLFVGPTGVGKTELAKQLVKAAFGSGDRLVRFDMSEYMAPGSATRLLDASHGVRSLVSAVRAQPLSLVLLDEIEKADPQVFDALLSALDEGRVTDTLGRACDLRSTMIVMTSNLGVRDRPAVGFGGTDEGDALRAVRAHFRPELYNRIDYVVPFRALSPKDVARIVRLELAALCEREGMKRRRIRLRASERAIEALVAAGYDPLLGARPLKRAIEERVVAQLAARMAAEPSLADVEVALVALDEPASGWVLRV